MAARRIRAEVAHDGLPFRAVRTDPGAVAYEGDDVPDLVRNGLAEELRGMSMQKRRVISDERPARDLEPRLSGSQAVQIETYFGWRHRQVEPVLRLAEQRMGAGQHLLDRCPEVRGIVHRRSVGSCLERRAASMRVGRPCLQAAPSPGGCESA